MGCHSTKPQYIAWPRGRGEKISSLFNQAKLTTFTNESYSSNLFI
jgi:hypothetical protein